MRILIVLGHPGSDSLNQAIAHAVGHDLWEGGHEILFPGLHAERFDPVLVAQEIPESGENSLQIQTHCEELCSADGIVIVHPHWWGQPPAILRGRMDRTFRPGLAYRFAKGDRGEGIPIGLLRARAAVVFNTSNTPEAREKTAFDDPRELLWRHGVFDLCGVRVFHRKMFSVVVTSTTRAASGLD
jgi:putative NADPH-quinone reductase